MASQPGNPNQPKGPSRSFTLRRILSRETGALYFYQEHNETVLRLLRPRQPPARSRVASRAGVVDRNIIGFSFQRYSILDTWPFVFS